MSQPTRRHSIRPAVPYRIKCLDRTHTNRKSTPDEWIVLVRPGCRPFLGILFRVLDVFAGHQEYLFFSVQILSEILVEIRQWKLSFN